MNRFAITLATIALSLAACAGETPGETGRTGNGLEVDPNISPDSTPPTDGDATGEVSQEMLDDLLEQAADETGVSADEISVVTAEAVTWSDGSLGCPEPGMGYTQALVPGYRVVLDVAGEEMHFHAGQDGQFRACADPQEPIEADR